jgi:hypothetical protein
MTTPEVLPEAVIPGRRLGRHIEHDERSRAYAVTTRRKKPISRRWARRSPVLDQGQVGSCVGNTFAGWLATDTALRQGTTTVDESLAVEVYGRATALDRIPGTYPPDDTGSTGLAGAKAMVALGLAKGPYHHAFSVADALLALSYVGPLCVGIEWREGLDTPDPSGMCTFSGAVRGGHEQLWDELDVEHGVVWFTNSWSDTWGVAGRACLSIADFGRALAAQGDVVVLTG